jgi:hypothetical protein
MKAINRHQPGKVIGSKIAFPNNKDAKDFFENCGD